MIRPQAAQSNKPCSYLCKGDFALNITHVSTKHLPGVDDTPVLLLLWYPCCRLLRLIIGPKFIMRFQFSWIFDLCLSDIKLATMSKWKLNIYVTRGAAWGIPLPCNSYHQWLQGISKCMEMNMNHGGSAYVPDISNHHKTTVPPRPFWFNFILILYQSLFL